MAPRRHRESWWTHKRQRYEAARRAEYRDWRARHRKSGDRVKKDELDRVVEAPRVFSLVENAEEMSTFCRDLAHDQDRSRKVFIEMGAVRRLTIDGVGVLLAVVRNAPFHVQVSGNRPKDAKVREVLEDSGFFRFVKRVGHEAPPQTSRGQIFKRYHDKVDPLIAQALIEHVTQRLFGGERRLQPCQSILLEAMQNTHNHAGRAGRTAWWWATAMVDERAGRASFCFLDRGVGIMKSVKLRPLRRALGTVLGAPMILRAVLRGEVGSRTGQPFRGKGLPWIYTTAKEGRVDDLVIVANEVYAAVSRDRYRTLSPGFAGTLLKWEVHR